MNNFKGFIIFLLACVAKMIFFFPALGLSIYQSIKTRTLGDYFYSLGIGIDVFGNKLIAPHANKDWVKKNGKNFGGNETISQVMAFNKHFGYNKPEADNWEKLINLVERNHLNKTFEKHELN